MTKSSLVTITIVSMLLVTGVRPAAAGYYEGFIYSGGTLTTLNYPSAYDTFANGINNVGQSVGYYMSPSNSGDTFCLSFGRCSISGFIYSGGTYQALVPPGTSQQIPVAVANGINDTGQVAGYYFDESGNLWGFLYQGGNYTTLSDPAAAETAAYGINDAGEIVGQIRATTSSSVTGFLYANGVYTPLSVPGSYETVAGDINASGEIVGWYSEPGEHGGFQGFLYADGTYATLNYPGAMSTTPSGINDQGEIVGTYIIVSGVNETIGCFTYSGGVYTALTLPGTRCLAGGINDSGTIMGALFNPVPEPSTFTLVAFGLLCAVVAVTVQRRAKPRFRH